MSPFRTRYENFRFFFSFIVLSVSSVFSFLSSSLVAPRIFEIETLSNPIDSKISLRKQISIWVDLCVWAVESFQVIFHIVAYGVGSNTIYFSLFSNPTIILCSIIIYCFFFRPLCASILLYYTIHLSYSISLHLTFARHNFSLYYPKSNIIYYQFTRLSIDEEELNDFFCRWCVKCFKSCNGKFPFFWDFINLNSAYTALIAEIFCVFFIILRDFLFFYCFRSTIFQIELNHLLYPRYTEYNEFEPSNTRSGVHLKLFEITFLFSNHHFAYGIRLITAHKLFASSLIRMRKMSTARLPM